MWSRILPSVSRARIGLLSIASGALLLAGCGSGVSGSVEVTRTSAPGSQAPTPTAAFEATATTAHTRTSVTATATATSGCPSAIAWSDALDHVGEQVTVRGPVKGTNYASGTKGKPTFLDVGKAYPDPARFTVLIWGDDRASFPAPPEKAYAGKTICVTGLVTSYKGGAEIEVSSPAAIVVE